MKGLISLMSGNINNSVTIDLMAMVDKLEKITGQTDKALK